jgi:hypothetical protein
VFDPLGKTGHIWCNFKSNFFVKATSHAVDFYDILRLHVVVFFILAIKVTQTWYAFLLEIPSWMP